MRTPFSSDKKYEIVSQKPGGSPPSPRTVGAKMATPKTAAGVALPALPNYAHGHTTYHKPLASKQGNSSTTAQPTHGTPITKATELVVRADAIINFATSITANQPSAGTLYDRIKAWDDEEQFVEVEGRVLPAAAYTVSYLRYLMRHDFQPGGYDPALANNAQGFGVYRAAALFGQRLNVTAQGIILAQPFVGTGAASAYAENDGISGEFDDTEIALAPYFVGRKFSSGVAAVNIKKARAFGLFAANDISSGFTIKAGNDTYTAEEISDIEQRTNDFLGTASRSITGAAAAAYRGARGQPQDPFTGAAVFALIDLLEEASDVSITIGTAQAIQVVALSEDSVTPIKAG